MKFCDRLIKKENPEGAAASGMALQEEIAWIERLFSLTGEDSQAWEEYWTHYENLPSKLQKQISYELAKRGYSKGMSGFHYKWVLPKLIFPFRMCGWADYAHPEWVGYRAQGVAFRIEEGCFEGRQAQLYYLDEDGFPADTSGEPELQQKMIQVIQEYSSGIADVHVEERSGKKLLLFRLEPAAVKETVSLSKKGVPTDQVGKYIFVLPRSGEFNCELGEIRDGEMIRLHKDNFCMK